MRARAVAPERCEPSSCRPSWPARFGQLAVGVGVGDVVGVGVGGGLGWFFTTFSVMVVLVGTVWPACGSCMVTIPSWSPGLDTSLIWTLLNPAFASCPTA